MKTKPLLVFATRHGMPQRMAAILTGYDVLHLTGRYYSYQHEIETIQSVCGERLPLVICVIMPHHWRIPFIQECRRRWHTPGVTIVRPVFAGDYWANWFVRYNAPAKGGLFETVWIPNGPNVETAIRWARKHSDHVGVQVE